MSHIEGKLKASLFRRLHQDAPNLIILQLATAGAPDREVIGNGFTSHWECKHGTPQFVSPGNQELMCQRIEVQGYCRYILWLEDEHGRDKRTLIVRPRHINDAIYDTYDACVSGHSHSFVSQFIQSLHHGHHNQQRRLGA